MKLLQYYLVYLFVWVITLLPLRILFLFSDLAYLFVAIFPGYRKEVVMKNLRNSFPERSEKELRSIMRKFYLHLTDILVESLKLIHISKSQLRRRYYLSNPGILDRLKDEGRSSIAVFSHYANWEWATIFQDYTKNRIIAVYKPLGNTYFDSLIHKLRSRFGTTLVSMQNTLRTFLEFRNNGICSSTLLLGDQTPAKKDIKYWTRFLNQDTSVFMGIEKMARKYDLAVLYFKVSKVKRGYYQIDIELLTEDPLSLKEYELTDMHLKKLEEQIIERPELWLWSHKRWKHKKKAGND